MRLSPNMVTWPPDGIVVAIQYWAGDEAAALRLARLLADIEPERRDDTVLALCRRFDCPRSNEALDTYYHCANRFRMLNIESRREGTGHPQGCNELWSGVMDQLAAAWQGGNLSSDTVFTCEPDGVPIRADWIDVLRRAHAEALAAGKRISGPFTAEPLPHINGSMILHLSVWLDRLSLHRTPATQAWDLFHSAVLRAEALPTAYIKNLYGAAEMSDRVLAALAKETAWLANVKDDSAVAWAERALVPAPAVEFEPEATNFVGRVVAQG